MSGPMVVTGVPLKVILAAEVGVPGAERKIIALINNFLMLINVLHIKDIVDDFWGVEINSF